MWGDGWEMEAVPARLSMTSTFYLDLQNFIHKSLAFGLWRAQVHV